MKKILLLVILLVAVNTFFWIHHSRAVDPPANVKHAFTKLYPAAHAVTWKRNDGDYKAVWGGASGKDTSVFFSDSAIFMGEENTIPVGQLPASIADYARQHYNGAEINRAGCKMDAKGHRMCTAEINGDNLVFDDNGNFLKVDN